MTDAEKSSCLSPRHSPLVKWALLLLIPLAALLCVGRSLNAEPPKATAAEREAFHKACAEKSAQAEKAGTMTVVGTDGWLFLGKELRHLSVGKFWGADAVKVSRATKPDQADPLPAILDFKDQLDKAGIELLLVPVPPKAIIYPEAICGAITTTAGVPPRLDTDLQAFYALLKEKGVAVLDLTDEFLASRATEKQPLFCRQDSHWSGVACELAAERIAGMLRKRPWLAEIKKRDFAKETRSIEIAGDLWQALATAKPPAESVALTFVGGPTGTSSIEPERDSPLVLLGDSHNLVFHSGGDMLAKGAGLPDQLAASTGFAVDLIGVRGSGATPARINLMRQSRSNAKYLPAKKCVIWCFTAREFTEAAGWQKVPVVK